jgi:hypothetical protein
MGVSMINRATGRDHGVAADKHVVILVHGMGKHAANDFRLDFIRAANVAMQRYRGFETKRIENLVILEEVNYDRHFAESRERMGRESGPIYARLRAVTELADQVLRTAFVLKLANVERAFGRDDYLYTHFLDAVLYCTALGARVRVEVGHRLASLIAAYPSRQIHVVAHSLGTAVVHDTLDLLYRDSAALSGDLPRLDVATQKLASVWMIANVSRLMSRATGLTDPFASVVKPVPAGCTNQLVTVSHRLDVFSWFWPFTPPQDDSWIPREYYRRAFSSIETSVVSQLNTHDFAGYIEDPRVSVPLLRRLVRLSPDAAELEAVADDHRQSDIPGAFDALREALKDIVVTDCATLVDVASAVREFREVVGQLQLQLDAMALRV